jgi:hypothetical protein
MVVLSLVLSISVGVASATAGHGKGGNSTNAKQCYKGGWQSLYTATGATFAGEEDCVSYAAEGGTLLTSPPTRSQIDCEALGGAFSTDPATAATPFEGTVLWTCNELPGFPATSLRDDCLDDGATTLGVSDVAPYDSTCYDFRA